MNISGYNKIRDIISKKKNLKLEDGDVPKITHGFYFLIYLKVRERFKLSLIMMRITNTSNAVLPLIYFEFF